MLKKKKTDILKITNADFEDLEGVENSWVRAFLGVTSSGLKTMHRNSSANMQLETYLGTSPSLSSESVVVVARFFPLKHIFKKKPVENNQLKSNEHRLHMSRGNFGTSLLRTVQDWAK